jgi:TonB family protein
MEDRSTAQPAIRVQNTGGARLLRLLVVSALLHLTLLPILHFWLAEPDLPHQPLAPVGILLDESSKPPENDAPRILEPSVPSKIVETDDDDAPAEPDPPVSWPPQVQVQPHVPSSALRFSTGRPSRGHRRPRSADPPLRPPDTEDVTVPDPSPVPERPPAEPEFPEAPPDDLHRGLPPGSWTVHPVQITIPRDTRERVISQINAAKAYPKEAVEAGEEGRVVVRFRLDAQGRARHVAIRDNVSGSDLLAAEALRVVRDSGPYPLPIVTRVLEGFVAVAVFRDSPSGVVRSWILRSCGITDIDEKARALAEFDGQFEDGSAWDVQRFPFKATYRFQPGSSGSSAWSLTHYSGARGLRPHFEAHPPEDGFDAVSEPMLLPIQFQIEDAW